MRKDAERARFVRLLKEGYSRREASKMVGVSRGCGDVWAKQEKERERPKGAITPPPYARNYVWFI